MNPSQARADNARASAARTWGGEFHPEFGPKRYLLEREQVEERTAVVEGFNPRPQGLHALTWVRRRQVVT
jgi:hypothetical protein